jgi:hypothetical protein
VVAPLTVRLASRKAWVAISEQTAITCWAPWEAALATFFTTLVAPSITTSTNLSSS